MDVPGASRAGQAPWKKMSAEELENQYSPSRWVVRLGAEEALRTYKQIGSEATRKARDTCRNQLNVPYGEGEGERVDIYFPDQASESEPGGLAVLSGLHLAFLHVFPWRVLAEWKALCRDGWKASFEELRDVDHFEIIENLTQKDDALTQIILKTIFQEL
ncbi:kynurenine formamidase isoform X4 [Sciurus carolinensis]|uniref:kynurenine formamidase isoform X4 n=1 Tax=Sciurus carolinensis TaxID=30640 RepID=UPI001FB499A2|nr:kynurenine formamidase isoform X4 [Sciurus carolinensis]